MAPSLHNTAQRKDKALWKRDTRHALWEALYASSCAEMHLETAIANAPKGPQLCMCASTQFCHVELASDEELKLNSSAVDIETTQFCHDLSVPVKLHPWLPQPTPLAAHVTLAWSAPSPCPAAAPSSFWAEKLLQQLLVQSQWRCVYQRSQSCLMLCCCATEKQNGKRQLACDSELAEAWWRRSRSLQIEVQGHW